MFRERPDHLIAFAWIHFATTSLWAPSLMPSPSCFGTSWRTMRWCLCSFLSDSLPKVSRWRVLRQEGPEGSVLKTLEAPQGSTRGSTRLPAKFKSERHRPNCTSLPSLALAMVICEKSLRTCASLVCMCNAKGTMPVSSPSYADEIQSACPDIAVRLSLPKLRLAPPCLNCEFKSA